MSNKGDFFKDLLTDLLARLGFSLEVKVVEDADSVNLTVSGEDLGILIGYHGETLSAIQSWLALAFYQKEGVWIDLNLDIAGYAAEREARLREIAVNAADRTRFLARPIELLPMPSFERRIVHTVVAEIPDMESHSIGEGFERRVVVQAKPV